MLGGDPPQFSQLTSPHIFTPTRFWKDNCCPVRWKLLIITSLVAALTNAGGMRALVYWLIDTTECIPSPRPHAIFALLAAPVLFTTLACVFVYRHTARRRKLQAALTALFTLVSTLAVLFAARLLLG